jgi:hypothetical protein
MNDLIQSLPPPLPTEGITHTWMGESWMVDGETSVMMVMKISSKSPSRHGARTEFLVPNCGLMVAALRNSIWEKRQSPDSFRLKGICRRKEGLRRRLGWLHHPRRGQAWAAPPGGEAASQPLSVSSSGSVGLLVK